MNLNELDIMEQEEEESQMEVLLDRAFPCGHFHASDKMISSKIPEDTTVNELWWSLAETEYKSELGSTCGCH